MFSQIHHAMNSKQQKENKREKEILVVSVFTTFMLSPWMKYNILTMSSFPVYINNQKKPPDNI